jgi:hypothetical protein
MKGRMALILTGILLGSLLSIVLPVAWVMFGVVVVLLCWFVWMGMGVVAPKNWTVQ